MLRLAGTIGGVALLAGIALGVTGRVSDHLGPDAALLFALGGPWFVVAFAVGAAARSPVAGAIGGAVALAVSVAVYYALMLAIERRGGQAYAMSMTLLWGGAAVPCGVLFGAAGGLWRGRRDDLRAAGLALLGGALGGEALLFLARGGASSSGWVLPCELLGGIALVLSASRTAPRLPVTIGTTAAAFSASAGGALRLLMRAQGWGG